MKFKIMALAMLTLLIIATSLQLWILKKGLDQAVYTGQIQITNALRQAVQGDNIITLDEKPYKLIIQED